MPTPSRILSAACLLLVPCTAQAKVLFLTKSAGFVHPVVKRAKQFDAAWAEHHLAKFAAPQFEVVCTQDCAAITAQNLKQYAAVVFYTTGELPLPEGGLDALLAYVQGGGGFVGIHCATDTFYKQPRYGEMIGGYFAGHPWHKPVGVLVENGKHPATALLGERFEITDEIYQFKDFDRSKVDVLLRLDPSLPDLGKGRHQDPRDYALSWSRDYGKGRVFYTALGHRKEVWTDRRYLKHLTSGIRWAMRSEDHLARPPKGAIVLFDGTNLQHWRHADGQKPAGFQVADGVMTVAKGSGSMLTNRTFRDFRMHLEFRTPEMPGKKGQARGNSGVYIQRRYEVQILDSFGEPLLKNGCAAIYRQKAADANVCRPPGEWQSYDIWFTAARFDDAGEKTANARITVIHNDVMVHDDYEITGKTGAGRKEGPEDDGILLQDHGNPVSFRNVWIVPG